MILVEETRAPDAALPVAAFREHLQLGRGFADDGAQDAVLLTMLRAAIAHIEEETAAALLRRAFKLVVLAWRRSDSVGLPRRPVERIDSFTIRNLVGDEEVVDPSRYFLRADRYSPDLVARSLTLPTIPVGGLAEVVFTAGFGSDWAGVPPDLAQAVLLLAAHYYEHRSAVGDRTHVLPLGVQSLLKPHRVLRLGGRR